MSHFFNWVKETNWVLSLLAAIPLSITANLLTPLIKNWLAYKYSIKLSSRLKELQSDLKETEEYISDREKLYLFIVRSLFSVLILMALGGAMSSIVPILSEPIGSIFYLLAILRANRCLLVVKHISYFETYKSEIMSKINEMKALSKKQ